MVLEKGVTLLMDTNGEVHKFYNRIDAREAIASRNYFELREEEVAQVTAEGYSPTEQGTEILKVIRSRVEGDPLKEEVQENK